MIPNFGNGMELRRHIFLDGGVWLIFANKERDTFIFHMQEDEYLVFSTTGQRGFGNHGSDVHDSVSRPFRAGPDRIKMAVRLTLVAKPGSFDWAGPL